jgi:chorismate dehydratase
VQSITLDVGSRTSVALTQILSRRRFGVQPTLSRLPSSQPIDDVSADAVLLIGDRAMRTALPGFPFAYDLGQEWYEWTGLPFVFAVWAARSGLDVEPITNGLHRSALAGQRDVAAIAQSEAIRLGLDPAFCRRYLSHIIRYHVGPEELEGLERFRTLAIAEGLAPATAAMVISEPA